MSLRIRAALSLVGELGFLGFLEFIEQELRGALQLAALPVRQMGESIILHGGPFSAPSAPTGEAFSACCL
ncbi:hypothetical protein SAMN04244575_05261 [Sinorhizobium meliloti]|nr:hypothetical protein SAMN04244575_05261 [Sinorhizobium meliloti]